MCVCVAVGQTHSNIKEFHKLLEIVPQYGLEEDAWLALGTDRFREVQTVLTLHHRRECS